MHVYSSNFWTLLLFFAYFRWFSRCILQRSTTEVADCLKVFMIGTKTVTVRVGSKTPGPCADSRADRRKQTPQAYLSQWAASWRSPELCPDSNSQTSEFTLSSACDKQEARRRESLWLLVALTSSLKAKRNLPQRNEDCDSSVRCRNRREALGMCAGRVA